jgi:hypothetical protein
MEEDDEVVEAVVREETEEEEATEAGEGGGGKGIQPPRSARRWPAAVHRESERQRASPSGRRRTSCVWGVGVGVCGWGGEGCWMVVVMVVVRVCWEWVMVGGRVSQSVSQSGGAPRIGNISPPPPSFLSLSPLRTQVASGHRRTCSSSSSSSSSSFSS